MIKNKSPNQSNSNFPQQKSAVTVLDRNVETSEQKQSSKQLQHTTKELQQLEKTPQKMKQETSEQKQSGQTEKSPSKEKERNSQNFPDGESKDGKTKQFIGKISKNTSNVIKDTLKDGAKKYQKELEKDDLGVQVVSQGITKYYGSVKNVKNTSGKIKRKLIRFINTENKRKKILKKSVTVPIKAPIKGTVKGLKSGASKYQQQLEQGDEGVKLVSQSATRIVRTTKKLAKNRPKANSKLGKLDKQNSKLIPFSKKDEKLKVESRTILKKKAIKKKMYAPQRAQNKAKAFTGFVSNLKDQVATLFKSLNKFDLKNASKLVGTKVAAIFGGGLVSVLPLMLVGVICILIAGMLGAGSSSQEQIGGNIGGNKNLSPEVEKWRSLVQQEAAAQGMEAYVSLILGIIQVESGGTGTRDIMQSSESAGYSGPNVFQTEEESVRQGVKHLKECLLILKSFGKGYENNIKALAQAYNFGVAFAGFVGRQGGDYSIEVAEAYSRDVVAPSLGNTTGITVPYVNETSVRVGKTYRYINGGNFLYGELVSEYIGAGAADGTGDGIANQKFNEIMALVAPYEGYEYVFGGRQPPTFDCSGLVEWSYNKVGIPISGTAEDMYNQTVPVEQPAPGDLVFFRNTYKEGISHIGIYIGNNQMFNAGGTHLHYADLNKPYWVEHFAGIRRVK